MLTVRMSEVGTKPPIAGSPKEKGAEHDVPDAPAMMIEPRLLRALPGGLAAVPKSLKYSTSSPYRQEPISQQFAKAGRLVYAHFWHSRRLLIAEELVNDD